MTDQNHTHIAANQQQLFTALLHKGIVWCPRRTSTSGTERGCQELQDEAQRHKKKQYNREYVRLTRLFVMNAKAKYLFPDVYPQYLITVPPLPKE